MHFYKLHECVDCGSDRIENKDLMLCASCNSDRRKVERVKPKVVKPPKKVSEKRAQQNQQYAKLRDEYLLAYPVCEVVECHNKSNQVHHMAGRENEKLLDVNYFLAVCPDCHRKITDDSAWAIEQGYSVLRSVTN